MNNTDERLLSLVRDMVMAECGDGSGLIVSGRWKELAELYAETIKPEYQERVDRDGLIEFSNGQESIMFCNHPVPLTCWDDITVIMP